MKKKILSIVLAVLMIVSLLPVSALATSPDASPDELNLQGSGTSRDPYRIYNSKDLNTLADYVNGIENIDADTIVDYIKEVDGKSRADISGKAHSCEGMYFKLMGNIGNGTGDNAPFTKIVGIGLGFDDSIPFKGHLDGNNKTVILDIDYAPHTDDDYEYEYHEGLRYGLVGLLGEGGEIKNLTTVGSVLGCSNVGGVCGRNDGGSISNCSNSASVTSNSTVASSTGGVCGNSRGDVINCSNSGSVSGWSNVGGVCGYIGGTISNCTNSGNVTGNDNVGGIGGLIGGATTGCSNSGDVNGNYNVGGVCGYANHADLTDCSNSGDVHASDTSASVGGICGYGPSETSYFVEKGTKNWRFLRGSKFTNCTNTGNVKAGDSCKIGGIAGWISVGIITNCNNDGSITAGSGCSAGGICGYTDIFKSYGLYPFIEPLAVTGCGNTGSVTVGSGSTVGGICGNNDFCSSIYRGYFEFPDKLCVGYTITECYNIGVLMAGDDSTVGGICGNNNVTAPAVGDATGEDTADSILNCYNIGGITAGNNSTVGGICGKSGGDWEYNYVSNCYNSGSISMGSDCTAGGVCGNFGKGVMTNCYNSGRLTAGTDSKVGGVYGSGQSASSFKYCYYDSTIFNGNVYGENVGSLVDSYGCSTEVCQSAASDGLLEKLNEKRGDDGLKWALAALSKYPVFHGYSVSAGDLWSKTQENALYRSADGKIILTKDDNGFALTLPGKTKETIPLSAFSGTFGENGSYTVTDRDGNSYQFVKPGSDDFYINFTGADGNTKEKLLVRHVHGSWVYTADEGTLTATCGEDGCTESKYSVSLTLIAPADKAYDGKPVDEATFDSKEMTAWSDAVGSLPTIQYYVSDGTDPLTELPTDTGIYAAVIKAGEATAQVYFAIWPEDVPAHAHTPKLVKGQAPTCTANGWTDYYECADNECGKLFSDPTCQNEITDLDTWKVGDGKIAATGHKAVNIPEKAATEAADGYKTYWYCPVCNSYYTDAACANKIDNIETWKTGDGKIEKLTAHEHSYGAATYIWNDGLTQCTAYRICTGEGCGNIELETVNAVKGESEITATFTNTAFAKQTKQITVPETHSHTYDKTVAAPRYLKNAATCTEAAVYYKSCECGEASATETFTSGSALGHSSIEIPQQDATTEKDGVKAYYVCRNCGRYFKESACENEITNLAAWKIGDGKINRLPAHEHSYGAVTYIWNEDLTKCTAYKTCECGHAVIEAVETAENGNEITATFKTDGFVKQTKTVTPPEAPHEHTFSDTWSRNACAHWHESTCTHDGYSVIKDSGAHDFDAGVAVTGGTKYICKTCGYEKIVADKGEELCTHEHLSYVNNGNGTHKVICSDCTETVKASEACVYDQNGGTKCICGAKAPSKTDVKICVDVKEIKTKKFAGFLFWGTWKDVTTYTATIKTEATGVKVTKVQYQLNGGRWTTGTYVSSDRSIRTLKIKAWDNTGKVYEYTYTK